MHVRSVLVSASLLLALACNGTTPSASSAPPPVAVDPPKPSAPTKPRPQGDPQPKLPVGLIEFESTPPHAPLTLKVEVAATDEQRQMGLMFREALAENEGMLFMFPSERRNSFWMHNTLIPLDMFFIDSAWNVVGVVENAEPLTDSPRAVARMSQYVLEVPAGFAQRHRFGEGHKLRFVPPGSAP